ncbi:hypothetical protein SASPL_101925 [Salvia splendens]|uniref:BED-type domain-containing protein n=1 Tax=Salvia splendens TaxID=180675 RepID=A0A8X8YQ69_SALSN|nr:hypothetical protein SASPL_101925 [Salvia splendens]
MAAALFLLLLSLGIPSSLAYRPGDIVPMSRMGQYHASRTVWHDMIGRHCPIFAVNREALIPIPKPTGYTGADPYKISFQVGQEKFYVPWLFVINRKSSEVPMIEMHLCLLSSSENTQLVYTDGYLWIIWVVPMLMKFHVPFQRYSGADLLGVSSKVVDMPNKYVELHPDIRKQFWDQQVWPKHILVRYTWFSGDCVVEIHGQQLLGWGIYFMNMEEQSEMDVASGFYVLFGSAEHLPATVQRPAVSFPTRMSHGEASTAATSGKCSNRTDLGWKYCSPIDEKLTSKVKCNFCNKEMNGGITRAKEHLMGKKGKASGVGEPRTYTRSKKRKESSTSSSSWLMLSFILSIYVLQSSKDKLARFVQETVAESSMPAGGVAKVE